MSEKQSCTVTLKERQLVWLREIADAYELSDESKALRVLIDYAISEPKQVPKIFGRVRCIDC